MVASIQSSVNPHGLSGNSFFPDGRQTRIDFPYPREVDSKDRISSYTKGNFDWWHQLTHWLKSGKSEDASQIDSFKNFLELREYSIKTRKSYIYMLRKFFIYLEEKKVKSISFANIEDYNYDFFVSGRYSRSYQLQFINSLTLYLEFSEGVKANLKGLRRSKSDRKKIND